MTTKEIFKQRFEKIYKGHRLLAIQLDGFTHRVIYDELEGNANPVKGKCHADTYSSCMSNEEARSYGMNNEKVCELFAGYGNSAYQNNAQEIIYVMPR